MFAIYLEWTQAAYYMLTGLWPIVHMRSFLKVTGPKHDLWLVKTVGSLITIVGLSVGVAAWRESLSPETALLAASSAASLLVIDLVYVAKGVIPQIYLADAVVEAIFLAAWVHAFSMVW